MKSLRDAVLMLAAVSAFTIIVSAQEQPAPVLADKVSTAQQPAQQVTQQPSQQYEGRRPLRAANMVSKQGEVTEATPDHFVIKTSTNEALRINYTEHTRITGGMGHAHPAAPAQASGGGTNSAANGKDRAIPGNVISGPISGNDITVGDYILTVGELNETDHGVINAELIAKFDAERVREMKAREAEFGKSWLAGKITAITGTTITISGIVDGAPHNVVVDENTSLTQRREPATLVDMHIGDMIRIDGAGTPGSDFHATKISTGGGRMMGGPGGMGPRNGPEGAPARIPNDAPAPTPHQTPAVQQPTTSAESTQTPK